MVSPGDIALIACLSLLGALALVLAVGTLRVTAKRKARQRQEADQGDEGAPRVPEPQVGETGGKEKLFLASFFRGGQHSTGRQEGGKVSKVPEPAPRTPGDGVAQGVGDVENRATADIATPGP